MALVGWGVERKKTQGYLIRSFLALSAAKKSEKELVEMKWPREGWGEEESFSNLVPRVSHFIAPRGTRLQNRAVLNFILIGLIQKTAVEARLS